MAGFGVKGQEQDTYNRKPPNDTPSTDTFTIPDVGREICNLSINGVTFLSTECRKLSLVGINDETYGASAFR